MSAIQIVFYAKLSVMWKHMFYFAFKADALAFVIVLVTDYRPVDFFYGR